MAQQRFTRASRLLTATDYQRVFKMPIRSSDKCFTVLARRSDSKIARLGLAIAKKHIRLAVDRNRIKRVIRENFRQRQSQLSGYDFVVLARSGTALCPNPQLSASLQTHWQRLTDLP